MSQRTANFAVKGYLYQFCKTIDEILSANDNDEIIIEGIEDIDVLSCDTTQLVQCKYHETQKFYPSSVYKPIGLMLKHHIENNDKNISIYTLYAYYKENAPEGEDWISREFLRKALNDVDDSATVSDDQLNAFIEKFRFLPGISFNELQSKVNTGLQNYLSCTQSDVELYYYNNAIAHIVELSARTNINERRIKKHDFKVSIDKKIVLFDTWFYELKGREKYIETVKKRFSNMRALNDVKQRFLLISGDLISNTKIEGIGSFLSDLVGQYQIINKLESSKLWTVIIDAEASQIRAVKEYLLNRGIHYNDGYEDISFRSQYFNEMPVFNTSVTNKIVKTSHDIRLISKKTFVEQFVYFKTNMKPQTFINTMRSLHEEQYFLDDQDVMIYQISKLDNLNDLSEILSSGRKV